MYKGSIELGRINKDMKLKFVIYLKEDPQYSAVGNKQQNLIEKFSYGASDYLRVSPNSQLVIDIQKSDNEMYDSNNNIALSKKPLFQLKLALKKFIKYFEEDDLFYYENKKLTVNKELAEKYLTMVKTYSKSIALKHCVVTEHETDYEGCLFMINSINNYASLTYEELLFLYDELDKVDLTKLSMDVINLNLLINLFEDMNSPAKKIAFQKLFNEQLERNNINKIPAKITQSEFENEVANI